MASGAKSPKSSAQGLPPPVLFGRKADAEVSATAVSSANQPSHYQKALRVLRRCFLEMLCAMIVVAVSRLIWLALGSNLALTRGTCVMAGCSMLAGTAGACLCIRASSMHTWSTAGFLLCTWVVGLLQTEAIQILRHGGQGHMLSHIWASELGNGILHPIQQLWLILLSVQRLNSLQTSAEYEFIPNLTRVFCVVCIAKIICMVVGIAFATATATLLPPAASNGLLFLQIGVICLTVWLSVRILMAYADVLRYLHTAQKVATNTCLREKGSAAACEALRRAKRAIRKESWGIGLVFASTFGAWPLAFVLIYFHHYAPLPWILMTVLLGNTLGSWFLSNAHKLTARGELKLTCCGCGNMKCSRWAPQKRESFDPWHQKVQELSVRGITVQALLNFYQQLGGSAMPHYRPEVHTTQDVVRQVIIPQTQAQRCSYALLLGGPLEPEKMVTHSWQNLFRDLVAAVIADAVGENSFEMVARLLENDVSVLQALMKQQGIAGRTYWICAFAVNQHAGICENSGGDRDSWTGQVHPGCPCGLPKVMNSTPPLSQVNNQSIGCEMNKFDDMVAMLAANSPRFSRVVAVDSRFLLFSRAWCVAELVEADTAGLKQHVQISSRKVLEAHETSLENLKVEDMQASRAEDVDFILNRIHDKYGEDGFNKKLQALIFHEHGLLNNWRQLDTLHQMQEIGSLLKWSMADGGRGVVWQFWAN